MSSKDKFQWIQKTFMRATVKGRSEESPRGGGCLIIILKVLDKDECSVTNGPVLYRIVQFQIYLPRSGLIYTARHKMSGFEKHKNVYKHFLSKIDLCYQWTMEKPFFSLHLFTEIN